MPYLMLSLMKCGANEQEAADAAQKAFWLLLRKWNTVSNPRAWLRTVAFRQLLPALTNKRGESSLEEAAENYAWEESPPVTVLIELREQERHVLLQFVSCP